MNAPLRVRAWVEDVWGTVDLTVAPSATVAAVKAEALRRATGREPDRGTYEVKFHGALVLDESRTLGDLGVSDHASLVVQSAKRRPVR